MSIEKEQARDNPTVLGGQRVTPQRLLLLDLIRQGSHLDADKLYRRAKEKEPRLSMSTVYRNLQLFVKLGLVEEHHFDRAHCCYEAKTKVQHQHLICLGCGRVIDFEYQLSQEMKENLEARKGFHTTGAKIVLVGLCSDCFQHRENAA